MDTVTVVTDAVPTEAVAEVADATDSKAETKVDPPTDVAPKEDSKFENANQEDDNETNTDAKFSSLLIPAADEHATAEETETVATPETKKRKISEISKEVSKVEDEAETNADGDDKRAKPQTAEWPVAR